MGGLAALFGNSEEKTQDSDKLMDLYWNRAELKKSFANEKKKQYKLQDRIKREEGKTARLQQKLDHLEDLLLDPEWIHNVVVFYQLRNLARNCERNLATFAEQLKLQREQKQQEKAIAEWKVRHEEEAARLAETLLNHRNEMQQLEHQLSAEQEALNSLGFLARIFKARSLKSRIRELDARLEAARAEEETFVAELAAVEEPGKPEQKGLDVASKRSINLMILSFAQELYLNFGDREFAALARESSQKSVGAVNYGNKFECTQLVERIEKQLEIMENNRDFADVLRKRATLISKQAEFRSKNDVVPSAASTETVFDFGEDDSVREIKVPILGENWWGIAKVLSR